MAQTTKRHTHTHNITQKQCTWSEFRKQINFYFLKHKYLHTFSSFIFNRLSSFQMDFFFFAMFSCCSSLFFRVLSKRSKMYIICLGELFNTSWLIPLHCDTFFPFLLHFFCSLLTISMVSMSLQTTSMNPTWRMAKHRTISIARTFYFIDFQMPC